MRQRSASCRPARHIQPIRLTQCRAARCVVRHGRQHRQQQLGGRRQSHAHGHAMLCGDPHQPFWVPSSWYEYAIHGPGGRRRRRWPSGRAGPVVGQQRRPSPGRITNNAASTRDLYREQVHPTDPHLYRDGDTWRRFERTDVVEFACAAKHQCATPSARPCAVRSSTTSCRPSTQLRAAPRAALGRPGAPGRRARGDRASAAPVTGRSFRARAARLGGGRLQLRAMPIAPAASATSAPGACRSAGASRVATATRTQPADAWQGYIPFEGLPSAVDPARGYVASANERVAPDDYPYPLHGSWGGGYRAERIRQALDKPVRRRPQRSPWRCRTTSRAAAPNGCARRWSNGSPSRPT